LAAHALFARPLIIGSDSKFSLDILDESTSDGWICCDGRRQLGLPRGTHIEVRESHDTLRLARLSGVPFTSRLVTKFDLPVVGWREHRYRKGGQDNGAQHGGRWQDGRQQGLQQQGDQQ
jgi:NAD+ kinase